MRLFIYEYTCAAGVGDDPLAQKLRGEGTAMLSAVLDDFRRAPGVEIVTLLTESNPPVFPSVSCRVIRASEEGVVFRELTAACDGTLVIAPECDNILETRLRWIDEAGGCSLGSPIEAARLTGDKLAMARHWHDHGIPTPESHLLAPDRAVAPTFPAVCKPRHGAGSTATFLVHGATELAACSPCAREEGWHGDMLVQPFVKGQPASVAFLVGLRQTIALMPTGQCLSSDGRFQYEGGTLPLPHALAERAERLARRAIACVPGLRGYVGVDLVLGAAADGSEDWAIELNPRWTTSYIGLRALCEANLAEVLLKTLHGEAVPPLTWRKGKVRFYANGKVEGSGLGH